MQKLIPFIAAAGLSRGGEFSKAEALAHGFAPADPNVCHMSNAMALVGSLLGDTDDLDGDDDDDELAGDAVLGMELIGAARRAAKKKGKPKWRKNLAPGVPVPGYGVVPLPLRPDANAGVFTPAINVIGFEARPQKPFRGERVLATVRRSAGAGGSIILASGIFVGTNLQQGELGEFDIEQFAPTAFGVRLVMNQAEPGVLIRVACRALPVVPADNTVATAIQVLGRYVHG